MTNEDIKKKCQEYEATGRLAWHYPKLKCISLNGGRRLPIKEAIKRMDECIKEHRAEKL